MAALTSKLPSGPKGRPVIGNMLDYSRDPLGYLTRCSREYGDVVKLRFPGTLAYLISHPDHVEQVLVKNNRNFIKDRYTRMQLSVLGNGLLVNDGDFWRRQRRLAQPAFHRRRVEAYGETMVAYTERLLRRLAGRRGPRRPQGDDAPDARDRRQDVARRGHSPRGRGRRGRAWQDHGLLLGPGQRLVPPASPRERAYPGQPALPPRGRAAGRAHLLHHRRAPA